MLATRIEVPYRKGVCVLLVVLLVVLAGCKDKKDDKSESPTEIPVVDVKVLVPSATPQYSGVIAAVSQGYYTEAKLNVELIFSAATEAASGADSSTRVMNGEAQFAFASADQILLTREAGNDVVGLMTLYQRDPTAIISLPETGIDTPEDLVGKRILVFQQSVSLALFLNTVGIDPASVTIVEPEGGDFVQGLTMFRTGEVDGFVGSGTEASAQLTAAGFDHRTMFFNDYGVLLYPNVIFASRQLVESDPALVQRFVNATLRGLQFVTEKPEEVAQYVIDHYASLLQPEQTILEVQLQAMQAILPLIQVTGAQLGSMTPETWQYVRNGTVAAGLLGEAADPTQAYTLTFVDAYYAD